jgi:hypothetical protein
VQFDPTRLIQGRRSLSVADCVKSVVRNDDDTFTYMEDPRHPEYEIPCTSFRTPAEQKRTEDYVG